MRAVAHFSLGATIIHSGMIVWTGRADMPQLAPTSVTLLDGDIVLTQRSRSSAWQARYKIGDRWVRVTTKQRNLKDAKIAAKELHLDAKFKHKHGMPQQTRRFKSVAELTIKSLETELANGNGKATYNDYIAAIKRYLIPFFGNHHIDRIDASLMMQFEQWRAEKMGKQPKASSIGTHNSALNRVMDEAVLRGFISEVHRPTLRNKGKGADRRPDFTLSEYRRMIRNLREWIKQGRDGKSREMRELLYDYVLILANTGMRHGTEADSLRWSGVRIEQEKGRNQLYLHVDGKTGPRELVARHNCVTYLKRIHQRTDAIKELTFTELLEGNHDLPVFVLPDGTYTDNLRATFRRFLTELKMLQDKRTKQNRTLYSLRHTYATLALTLSNIGDQFLADQMGTSPQMINKHYSHVKARMKARELSGKEHGVYNDLDAKV